MKVWRLVLNDPFILLALSVLSLKCFRLVLNFESEYLCYSFACSWNPIFWREDIPPGDLTGWNKHVYFAPQATARGTWASGTVGFAQNFCSRKFLFHVHFLSTQLFLLLVIEDCVWKNKQKLYMTVLGA